MTANKIEVDQFIPSPPDSVWAAITTPEQLERWWVPGDVQATVGHHFTLRMDGWGDVPAQVLDVVENQRFVHTFADWTLTWTLLAEGNGTRLFLEHSGFDLDDPQHRFAFDNMGPGWRDTVLPRLANMLAG